MLRRLLPLIVFLALAGLLFAGIRLNEQRDPNALPSPLIGRQSPGFSLPRLDDPSLSVQEPELRGTPYLMNVWGSWCPACRIEHPVVEAIARAGQVRVIGFNYKDERGDALRWLGQFGDPYEFSVVDEPGRTAIEWGVYGAPETFLVDSHGVVRFKHVGPLTWDLYRQRIVPLLEADTGATP